MNCNEYGCSGYVVALGDGMYRCSGCGSSAAPDSDTDACDTDDV